MYYPLPNEMPWREKAAIMVRRGEAPDFYTAAAMLARHVHRRPAKTGIDVARRVFISTRALKQSRLPYADN